MTSHHLTLPWLQQLSFLAVFGISWPTLTLGPLVTPKEPEPGQEKAADHKRARATPVHLCQISAQNTLKSGSQSVLWHFILVSSSEEAGPRKLLTGLVQLWKAMCWTGNGEQGR